MRFSRRFCLSLALVIGFSQTTAAAGPAVERLQALVEGPHKNIAAPDWEKAWQEASQEAFSSLFTNAADWLVDSSVDDDGAVEVRIEVYSPDYWTNPVQSLFLSAQIGGDAAGHAARYGAVLEPVELGWFWVREETIDGQAVTVNNLAEEAIDSVAWQRAGAVFEVRHATDALALAQSVMQRIESSGLAGVFAQDVSAVAVAPAVAKATPRQQTATSVQTPAVTPQAAMRSENLAAITLDAASTLVRTDERGPIYDAPLRGEPYPQSGDIVRLPGSDTQGWVEAAASSKASLRACREPTS